MPDWLPSIPGRLAKRIAHYTPHRDGFYRSYRGKTYLALARGKFLKAVEAGGITAALDALDAAWEAKREGVDAPLSEDAPGFMLADLISEFLLMLDVRVKKGKPRRMSAVTAWDYQRTLTGFGVAVGPHIAVDDLGPANFSAYADRIVHDTAASFTRKVAYIEHFIRWGLQAGRFATNATVRGVLPGMDPLRTLIGPNLTKAPKEDMRDDRLEADKAFTPVEFGKLWAMADDRMRLWMILGVTGGMDNGDISHVARSMVIDAADVRGLPPMKDGPALVIDFRRRKRGKIRRVIPLVPEAERLFRLYHRPSLRLLRTDDGPDDDYAKRREIADDLVFLWDDGTPLFRMTAGGPQNVVTREFTKLLIRTGLRPKPRYVRVNGKKRKLSAGDGDGRNFRSLRTMCANLAPPGYSDESRIVMGHAHGTVPLDSYLETHGFKRLFSLLSSVWQQASSAPPDAAWTRRRLAEIEAEAVAGRRRGKNSPSRLNAPPQ